MSILSKARKLTKVASNPGAFFGESRYLFILSHMRSRSSVLSHILGSNNEVCGYGELHQSYESKASLLRMKLNIYKDNGEPLAGKLLLDKVLHNRYQISKDLVEDIQPKIIFLLREPELALKSFMNLAQITGNRDYMNPDVAADYYCERLSVLLEYINSFRELSVFVNAESLVSHPESQLESLSNWLSLASPLDKDYSLFRKSGEAGVGDISSNISSGTLLKTSKHDDISLSQSSLSRARLIYDQCCECLV